MEDHQIIELYAARSEQAIAETDAKYGGYCLSIANRILAVPEDAEETVNDTYLAAWKAIPPDYPPLLSLYLGKITRNLSIDRWRTLTAEKRGGTEFDLCLEELENSLFGKNDPEQAAIQKEMISSLNRFLRKLPEVERKIFLCRYWYLDSIQEISKNFGFSQTNVTTLLYRTRRRLRRQLEREGFL